MTFAFDYEVVTFWIYPVFRYWTISSAELWSPALWWPSFLPGSSFQISVQWGDSQVEPCGLTELRTQRLELGEAKTVSLWEAEFWRQGSGTEKNSTHLLSVLLKWLNTNLLCIRGVQFHKGTASGGRNPLGSHKQTILRALHRAGKYLSIL